MVDNYLNKSDGDEYEEAIQQITRLIDDFKMHSFRYYDNEPLKTKLSDLYNRSFFLQALVFTEALITGSFHNLIIGNILAYFTHLRLALESLAEALIIDYRYGFRDEEEHIEKCMDICMRRPNGKRRERCIEMCRTLPLYRKYVLWRRIRRRIPTTRVFMEQLATIIGEKNTEKATLLWNRLSSKWIHFTGYANEMSKAWIPPYVPAYVTVEVDSTQMRESIELARAIAIIRKLICAMFNPWLTKVEEYDKDIAKCFTKCNPNEIKNKYIKGDRVIERA
jgi:hypothetical protein